MSGLVTPANASPGHVAMRKFDHAEAIRRYEAGELVAWLARDYGVSASAVRRVVNPRVRVAMDKQCRNLIDRKQMPCRGGCGVLVWMHQSGRSGYCLPCLGEKQREARGPKHGTEYEYSAGCRCGECRRASNAARQRRREAAKAPCSHGCGTLVHTHDRRNRDKPLECRSCAMKRVQAERKAAAA